MSPETPDTDPAGQEPSAGPRGKPAATRSWLRRAQDWWYYEFRKIVGAWVFAVVLLTVVSLGVAAMDFTDYIFSHNTFCGNVCHVMESTVYQELQKSKHWNTPTGVRPTCAHCHVSGRLTFAMVQHIVGTGELFVALTNDFKIPGSFEKFRPAAADRARFQFFESDSRNCRDCHVMEGIKPSRVRGQNAHNDAMRDGTTNCITCHYNLVHKLVEPSKSFTAAIDAYFGSRQETAAEEKPASDAGEGEAELEGEGEAEGEVL